jgi:hypothetical protein
MRDPNGAGIGKKPLAIACFVSYGVYIVVEIALSVADIDLPNWATVVSSIVLVGSGTLLFVSYRSERSRAIRKAEDDQ